MNRSFKRGIEGQIKPAQLLINDGTDLQRPGIGRKDRALISEFSRQAHAYRPSPTLRDPHSRTYMIANPFVTLSRSRARENVKAGFEPVIPALCDLHRF